ncbi:MAG: hypothetical protein DME69_14625 [Verrucomicrobia bacterium]|nr:MAG: hypothetical protein DME69_14625 [Verrucomicrobiota bacterium]
MRISLKPRSRHSHHAVIIAENDSRTRDTRISREIGLGCFDSRETNAAKLTRRVQGVRRATERSVVDLLKRCADDGYKIRRAALVVGSVIDPDSIANPHIRAHALEGRLFRTTLEAVLQSRGIQCAIFIERDTYATASKLLRQSRTQIQRTLAHLRRSVNGPWRADQKLAALAAWMSL